MKGVYAGSFDPPTIGHEEIIRRAAGLLDELIVMISVNPAKKGLFSQQQRKQWLDEICRDLNNTEVVICTGLTVDEARKLDADVLIRSMRSQSDYPAEASAAWINEMLENGMETLFLLGNPACSQISSTAVRELLQYHQSIEALVPHVVFEALQPALAAQAGAGKKDGSGLKAGSTLKKGDQS